MKSSQTGAMRAFKVLKFKGLHFKFDIEISKLKRSRYAVTAWFFDKTERERAKEESKLQGNSAL